MVVNFTAIANDLYVVPRTTRNPAADELDNFSRILEMEGVIVRRPEVRPGDFDRPVSTPDFESKTQLYAAMPRDVLIVVSLARGLLHIAPRGPAAAVAILLPWWSTGRHRMDTLTTLRVQHG